MYTILGAAVDGRIYQFPRLLGLTAPIGELSSDTLVTAYNPDTQTNWTLTEVQQDPEWRATGNPNDSGETNGYAVVKLRTGEPLSETNFKLVDVPGNRFELVWKWLRSKVPNNAGDDFGTAWRYRDGVVMVVNSTGTLPDSNVDASGNYSAYNANPWIRVDITEDAFEDFDRWRTTYLVSDAPQVCYVEDQYEDLDRVGRSGDPIPNYVLENPPGTVLLRLIDPLFVEAGLVHWTRLQR